MEKGVGGYEGVGVALHSGSFGAISGLYFVILRQHFTVAAFDRV